MSEAKRASAPAVTRAAGLLGQLSQKPQPQRLSDLASALGLPVSSTASICNALEDERLIRRTSDGYLLGPRIVEFAHTFLATVDPLASFGNVIADSPVLRHQTVQLAMLDNTDVLYLARRDADRPFQISSNVGKRIPASCTAVGKAMIAAISPADRPVIDHFERLTEFSIVSSEQFVVDLEAASARGFAIDDQETSIGVICFGVALNPLGPEPRYGISVTVLKAMETDELRSQLVDELKRVALSIFPAAA